MSGPWKLTLTGGVLFLVWWAMNGSAKQVEKHGLDGKSPEECEDAVILTRGVAALFYTAGTLCVLAATIWSIWLA